MSWLDEHLDNCELTEEVEDYVLGRGAKEETIQHQGLVTWEPLLEPAPDRAFVERYGPHGEKLRDMLICPLYSPRGDTLGFEARSIHRKYITQFKLMPKAFWNPVWIGLHPEAMRKIWEGALICVVEGQFDLYALEWALDDKSVALASLRARLTPEHVEFLRRMSLRGCVVGMVYDRDESGRKGTHGWTDEETGKERWGALKVLERVGVVCGDVPYTGGDDPGEIWDAGGAAAVRESFQEDKALWICGRQVRTSTTS